MAMGAQLALEGELTVAASTRILVCTVRVLVLFQARWGIELLLTHITFYSSVILYEVSIQFFEGCCSFRTAATLESPWILLPSYSNYPSTEFSSFLLRRCLFWHVCVIWIIVRIGFFTLIIRWLGIYRCNTR